MLNSLMAKFRVGGEVEWQWGRGHATGIVSAIFTESVTRKIKGSKITRHGTPDKPAYLVTQKNGNTVLKSETELHEADHKHGWA